MMVPFVPFERFLSTLIGHAVAWLLALGLLSLGTSCAITSGSRVTSAQGTHYWYQGGLSAVEIRNSIEDIESVLRQTGDDLDFHGAIRIKSDPRNTGESSAKHGVFGTRIDIGESRGTWKFQLGHELAHVALGESMTDLSPILVEGVCSYVAMRSIGHDRDPIVLSYAAELCGYTAPEIEVWSVSSTHSRGKHSKLGFTASGLSIGKNLRFSPDEAEEFLSLSRSELHGLDSGQSRRAYAFAYFLVKSAVESALGFTYGTEPLSLLEALGKVQASNLEVVAGSMIGSLDDILYEACLSVARFNGRIDSFIEGATLPGKPMWTGQGYSGIRARVIDAAGDEHTSWREVDLLSWLDDDPSRTRFFTSPEEECRTPLRTPGCQPLRWGTWH